jgi:hypothetical protein
MITESARLLLASALFGACVEQQADPSPTDRPIHSCDGVAVDIEWSALQSVQVDAASAEAAHDALELDADAGEPGFDADEASAPDAMEASVDTRSVDPVRALIEYLDQTLGEANDCTVAPFGGRVVCAPAGSTMCLATPADGEALLARVNEVLAIDDGGMLPIRINRVSLDTCPCRNYY